MATRALSALPPTFPAPGVAAAIHRAVTAAGADLTAERLTAHLRTVSDVRDPRATLSTRSFVVESGRPGAVPAQRRAAA
jgi:hypothetical protein